MSFRFRKSIKILPGVRINLSKNGFSSVSIGRRGATVNIRRDGESRATIGIPGTGISWQTRLDGPATGAISPDTTVPFLTKDIFPSLTPGDRVRIDRPVSAHTTECPWCGRRMRRLWETCPACGKDIVLTIPDDFYEPGHPGALVRTWNEGKARQRAQEKNVLRAIAAALFALLLLSYLLR